MRAPILGVMACLALVHTPAEAAGKQVRIAYVEWADAVVATNILKLALEEKGYQVKTIPLAAAAMWQAVATGDADASVAAWLPVTQGAYYEKLKNRIDLIGPNVTGAKIGWAVPAYSSLNSIEDLATKASEVDGKVVGIDPGAGVTHPPRDTDLAAFFDACFRLDANPLIDAARAIVLAHAEGRGGLKLTDLGEALRELPVITIRKWAYEHGFAFFWRALRWPDPEFQRICDEIEALVNGLTALHYAVLKLARTGDAAELAPVLARLDALDAQEFSIKGQLAAAYAAWRQRSPDLGHAAPPSRERLSA